MIFGFLTEANSEIGFGHLYRSIAIAQEILKKDSEVCFFLSEKKEIEILEKILPNAKIKNCINDSLNNLLHEINASAIIVDIFHLNISKYSFLTENKSLKKIMIIDNAYKEYALNFEYVFAIGFQVYNNHVKKVITENAIVSNQYSGTDYIIVRNEFKRQFNYICKENVREILITMGGSDPCNLTEQVLDSIVYLTESYSFTVILGSGFSKNRLKEVEKRTNSSHHKFKILKNIDNISNIMILQDLAIINGGNTRFELALIGVPFLSIAINEIQQKISNAIAHAGLGISLPVYNQLTMKELAKNIECLINSVEKRKNMSKNMKERISPNGSKNIVKVITNSKK